MFQQTSNQNITMLFCKVDDKNYKLFPSGPLASIDTVNKYTYVNNKELRDSVFKKACWNDRFSLGTPCWAMSKDGKFREYYNNGLTEI